MINYGEWIISDDESLTEFLRAPCDYASQIKLNILQVYVKKESKNHLVHSPIQTNVHTQFDDPTSDVNAYLTQYNTFFDMNAPQYIMPSSMPTQFSIPDLNETLDESDRGLTLRDTNNVDLFVNDYNYGQSSQLGWMHNAGTSANVHLSLSLDIIDYYRNNVKQGEHIITDDTENGDQPNYGELSQGDDSEPNNAEGGECPYESSSSDNDVRSNSEQRTMSMSSCPQQESISQLVLVSVPINRPHFYYNEVSFLDHFQERSDVFMNMHEDAFNSVNVWREPSNFLSDNFYLASTDGNGSIFPLAFAIVANESLDTWTKFLHDLHLHVMCGRQGITLISDRHHGILGSVSTERHWQASFAYHRYCLRHLKANYQRAFKSVRLNNLLWAAAIATQEKFFLLQMELIKETHLPAYEWLMNIELEKWTMHRDEGRRWGMLTTNSSESFNGLLKSTRGLLVTAMVKMSYNMIVDRFVQRSKFAKQLLGDKQKWMSNPFKKFEDYRKKASMHSI
ncbi:putative aspartic proteinase nepenthesin-2-like [Capsicum annuum]|nr:putative aspartic proteinase nepenthesin-2-like [Capsicum annuum]